MKTVAATSFNQPFSFPPLYSRIRSVLLKIGRTGFCRLKVLILIYPKDYFLCLTNIITRLSSSSNVAATSFSLPFNFPFL